MKTLAPSRYARHATSRSKSVTGLKSYVPLPTLGGLPRRGNLSTTRQRTSVTAWILIPRICFTPVHLLPTSSDEDHRGLIVEFRDAFCNATSFPILFAYVKVLHTRDPLFHYPAPHVLMADHLPRNAGNRLLGRQTTKIHPRTSPQDPCSSADAWPAP